MRTRLLFVTALAMLALAGCDDDPIQAGSASASGRVVYQEDGKPASGVSVTLLSGEVTVPYGPIPTDPVTTTTCDGSGNFRFDFPWQPHGYSVAVHSVERILLDYHGLRDGANPDIVLTISRADSLLYPPK